MDSGVHVLKFPLRPSRIQAFESFLLLFCCVAQEPWRTRCRFPGWVTISFALPCAWAPTGTLPSCVAWPPCSTFFSRANVLTGMFIRWVEYFSVDSLECRVKVTRNASIAKFLPRDEERLFLFCFQSACDIRPSSILLMYFIYTRFFFFFFARVGVGHGGHGDSRIWARVGLAFPGGDGGLGRCHCQR